MKSFAVCLLMPLLLIACQKQKSVAKNFSDIGKMFQKMSAEIHRIFLFVGGPVLFVVLFAKDEARLFLRQS